MYKELKSEQDKETSNEQLCGMINDIRDFLNQSEGDYKTNQSFIGMKYLFRGFVITNLYKTNFNTSKYIKYNQIINKHYMKYYILC